MCYDSTEMLQLYWTKIIDLEEGCSAENVVILKGIIEFAVDYLFFTIY
jgi:hypothetical protein